MRNMLRSVLLLVIVLMLSTSPALIKAEASEQPATEACLYCLCEAISGCNSTAICVNGACGIFRITWAYWVDAGQHTYQNESSLSDDAFPNCVNDPQCGARTVQGYMSKFGQDCNDDGEINCYDYGAMHKLGYLNCKGEVPYIYQSLFSKCLAAFEREESENNAGT